ncbi:uncharacterized protein LOC119112874 [Pollicipes pollicipes]|uniref:uncharacterized protein LOC119112874 n=1 Tax=Pollicipes pollicipes TaxID=41117 RepID=UPI001885547A|nr:uncharacterized protein LOC119112874 [Pollicipes pollicipes]
MGNVCGGSKLQVHIQESFTYETILDRYIDAHLQELIANAMHLTERCSTQPTIDTSTWADPSSLQVTDRLERRLSMRQERRQSQEQDQTLFKVPQSDAEHRGSDKHLPDAAQERRGSQSDLVQERSGTAALPAKPSGSAAAQRPSGGLSSAAAPEAEVPVRKTPSLPPVGRRSLLQATPAEPNRDEAASPTTPATRSDGGGVGPRSLPPI